MKGDIQVVLHRCFGTSESNRSFLKSTWSTADFVLHKPHPNIIPPSGQVPATCHWQASLESCSRELLLRCCLSLQLVWFHEARDSLNHQKRQTEKNRAVWLVRTPGCGGIWPKRLDLWLAITHLILHRKDISLIHLFNYLSCYVLPLNCHLGKAFML